MQEITDFLRFDRSSTSVASKSDNKHTYDYGLMDVRRINRC